MGIEDAIAFFISGAGKSPHIDTVHIGVYCVLLQYCLRKNGNGSVPLTRARIMNATRVASPTTYFRLLKDLDRSGFIEYCPSYHPKGNTKIILLFPGRKEVLTIRSNNHEDK